jgi:hypothetical protein
MNKRMRTLLFAIGMGALALPPRITADEWNQKTIFTFSGPVEIPGQVLPAGTYVFKLANSQSSRHIVQVFNKSEDHIFGTFLAIPDYRMRPSDKPIIRFEERAGDQPQAIKAWFYPGRNYGHEFVYPKKEAVALAQANHTPVPAMPAELTPVTTQPDVKLTAVEVTTLVAAPLKAEEPNGDEVEIAQAFPPAPAAIPDRLPDTATSAPLALLLGVLSVSLGLFLRFRPTRTAEPVLQASRTQSPR